MWGAIKSFDIKNPQISDYSEIVGNHKDKDNDNKTEAEIIHYFFKPPRKILFNKNDHKIIKITCSDSYCLALTGISPI